MIYKKMLNVIRIIKAFNKNRKNVLLFEIYYYIISFFNIISIFKYKFNYIYIIFISNLLYNFNILLFFIDLFCF